MAFEENDRTMARKRLYLIPDGQDPDPADNPDVTPDPGSDPYVDVPVITRISFIADGSEQYQETEYNINNSAQSGRSGTDANGNPAVHVDKVFQTDMSAATSATDNYGNTYQVGTISDFTQFINVERVDVLPTIGDGSTLYQQTDIGFDNKTGGNIEDGGAPGIDTAPPHFRAHLKTHVFRYVNPNNPDWWADSEIIDQYSCIADGSDQYQETQYTLTNPDVQADPDWPEISDSDNGIDPSWRLDPFQNIVNVSLGIPAYYAVLCSDGVSYFFGDNGGRIGPSTKSPYDYSRHQNRVPDGGWWGESSYNSENDIAISRYNKDGVILATIQFPHITFFTTGAWPSVSFQTAIAGTTVTSDGNLVVYRNALPSATHMGEIFQGGGVPGADGITRFTTAGNQPVFVECYNRYGGKIWSREFDAPPSNNTNWVQNSHLSGGATNKFIGVLMGWATITDPNGILPNAMQQMVAFGLNNDGSTRWGPLTQTNPEIGINSYFGDFGSVWPYSSIAIETNLKI
jgi:hypothetical protein